MTRERFPEESNRWFRREFVREGLAAWDRKEIGKYEFYGILRYHVGPGKLSYAEVSEMTGISIDVIKMRFRDMTHFIGEM